MSRRGLIFSQALLTVGQFAPIIFPLLDAKGLEAWHGMISALQGGLAAWAQGFNPDGTPAAVAYTPK